MEALVRGSVASWRARWLCIVYGGLFALTGVPSPWRGAGAQQTPRTWVPGSWTVVTSLAANPLTCWAPPVRSRPALTVRSFRGVGEPRTAPKLKGETLAIGGHRITGFRPGPGTRIVAMASSVDAD